MNLSAPPAIPCHPARACRGLLLLALLLAGGAVAKPPTRQAVQDAQRAAQAQQEAAEAAALAARAAAAEERRLAERRVEAARRAQAADQRLAEAEDRAAAANAATEQARARGREQAAALAPMLPLMLRLGLWPAESLLAVPGPPAETLRGLLVLQGLSRHLAAEASALRATEAEAARRAAEAATQATALREAQANARTASAALEAELQAARERRAGADDAETEASRRAAALAARATSLEGALARLRQAEARAEAEEKARERAAAARARRDAEAETAAARIPAPAETPGTGRAMPVAGRVVREFGSAGEGGAANGLTLRAVAGARVVSPCSGKAVFAAPFRSFGQLLIVDCGGGYHFVLAGLDRLEASPGQRLLAGEPVGQLGDGAGTGEAQGHAALYLELRRNGKPVDPRGWLASRG